LIRKGGEKMSDLENSVDKTTVGESMTEETAQKTVQNTEEHSDANASNNGEYSLSDDRRVKTLSPGAMVAKRFFRNRIAVLGMVVLIFMFLFSFLGGALMPYGESQLFYRKDSQSQKYADINAGTGAIVIGLAAIVIGEVILGKVISFWMKLSAAVVGSIVYFVIRGIVLQLGMDANDMKMLSAIIVALALAVPVMSAKIRAKRAYSPKGE